MRLRSIAGGLSKTFTVSPGKRPYGDERGAERRLVDGGAAGAEAGPVGKVPRPRARPRLPHPPPSLPRPSRSADEVNFGPLFVVCRLQEDCMVLLCYFLWLLGGLRCKDCGSVFSISFCSNGDTCDPSRGCYDILLQLFQLGREGSANGRPRGQEHQVVMHSEVHRTCHKGLLLVFTPVMCRFDTISRLR